MNRSSNVKLTLILLIITSLILLEPSLDVVTASQNDNHVSVIFYMTPETPMVGQSVLINYRVIDAISKEPILHVEASIKIINERGELIYSSPTMHSHEGDFSFIYKFNEPGTYTVIIEAKSTPELVILGGTDFGTVRETRNIRVLEERRSEDSQMNYRSYSSMVIPPFLSISFLYGVFLTVFLATILSYGNIRNPLRRQLLKIVFIGFLSFIAAISFAVWYNDFIGLVAWLLTIIAGLPLVYLGPRRMLTNNVVLGSSAGVAAFFSDLLFIYYFTGIYKYAGMLYTLLWLIKYFAPYLLAFGVGVGLTVGITIYAKRLGISLKPLTRAGSLGSLTSVFSSLFFVCCSPLVASLLPLLGGTVIALIIYSKELFITGIVLQVIGVVYAIKKIRQTKERCNNFCRAK